MECRVSILGIAIMIWGSIPGFCHAFVVYADMVEAVVVTLMNKPFFRSKEHAMDPHTVD